MKILILEDEDDKFDQICEEIQKTVHEPAISREKNWLDYSRTTANERFDLILLDLLVPRSPRDNTVEDHHGSLVETTRDYSSKSFKTPAIVLTRHNLDESDFVHDLNKVDINVIPFNDHGEWREALKIKLLAALPPPRFEFVVICALEKEMNAFENVADSIRPTRTISGLICREMEIEGRKGVVVRATRMGLVSSAVIATMAIERFEPRLVCMSGICGGIANEANIYDLLITQTCHQHDAGKWSDAGFRSEHFSIQLEVDVHNKLIEICALPGLERKLLEGITPGKSEIPDELENINFRIHSDAATSSGSAVLAQEGKTATLSDGQRKLAGFDMEVYSIYEASRNSLLRPVYFAVKAVVDDGGKNKGDKFHRIGCLLSARLVGEAIKAGIADIRKRD